MLPEIWGEHGWNFLHLVTLGYPELPTKADKENYYNYLHYLQYVLPCAKCRYNMTDHLEKYPLTDVVLENRTNLTRWGIDLHNVVNFYTGKPMLSYEEAMKEINNLAQPRSSFANYMYIILVIILVILIFYLLYKKLN